MNKHISSFMTFALCVGLAIPSLFAAPKPRLTIIATTFPIYDWTRQILGNQLDAVALVQLQDNGVDLHNFQPTVREIAQIGKCDLFLYVGGESDEWVDDALLTSSNPRRIALNLMKELGSAVREEKPLEGMEAHHHHGDQEHHEAHGDHHKHAKKHDEHHHDEHHHDEHHHDEHHDDEHEADEHIWLSLRCATTLCKTIADSLSNLDSTHSEEYQANCRQYVEKLLALDEKYRKAVAWASLKTLLFADRFPFRYLADDYGLTCFAAFSGCSSESEASFKTIAFLASKVDELKLPSVLVLENRKHRIAETVVRTAKRKGVQILAMDSLQATTSREATNGKSYLETMEKNLAVLKKALLCKD